jgi:hypothetical protein
MSGGGIDRVSYLRSAPYDYLWQIQSIFLPLDPVILVEMSIN